MDESRKFQSTHYGQIKMRWRQSINQFSKMQQDSKLSIFDTKQKKLSSVKLKMINRLAQIDEDFDPFAQPKYNQDKKKMNKQKLSMLASTNHKSNGLTSLGTLTNVKMEKSIVILNPQIDNQDLTYNRMHVVHEVSDQIMEELTEYNHSKYQIQMKQHCSKYNNSTKSFFYSIFNSAKKELPQFCYICDQIIKMPQEKPVSNHCCKNPINSLFKVHEALLKMKLEVQEQNNKIFNVFLHNTLQPHVEIDQLIGNVRVLKQALQLRYEPQQAILRMRLMNLMGKKIAMLLQEDNLDKRLSTI